VPSQVDDDTALGRDLAHRLVELRTAVAPQRAEHVARQAFRVQPDQGRPVADLAADQGQLLGPVDGVAVAVGNEIAVLRR
jgi:hypothetical protein